MDDRISSLFELPESLATLGDVSHPKSSMVRSCLGVLDGNAVSEGVAFFIPGRIEVFGKHTDYCGGRSLLCAVDRGFVMVARARGDSIVRVRHVLAEDEVSFALSRDLSSSIGHWSNYPMTAAARVARNFPEATRGMDLAFASDLPPAAGLSSSSALIVGIFLSLATINRLHQSRRFQESIQSLEDLAHYCGCIENGSGFRQLAGASGVGTTGGSQDQTAILCCRQGKLSQYGFAPVAHERDVAFPEQLQLLVLNSGVVAEKTGSARELYNAASDRARKIVALWNESSRGDFPTLASIVRRGHTEALRAMLAKRHPQLLPRLEQFVAESEQIIPRASNAIAAEDLASFADLTAQSVRGAIEKLHNQVPQTIELTRAAIEAGALAASPFGAGFGGSVWAMVEREEVQTVIGRLQHLLPARDGWFATAPGKAAHRNF
jgi:galactokinase